MLFSVSTFEANYYLTQASCHMLFWMFHSAFNADLLIILFECLTGEISLLVVLDRQFINLRVIMQLFFVYRCQKKKIVYFILKNCLFYFNFLIASSRNRFMWFLFHHDGYTWICFQWSPDKSSVFGSSAEDGILNIWDHEKVWSCYRCYSMKTLLSLSSLLSYSCMQWLKIILLINGRSQEPIPGSAVEEASRNLIMTSKVESSELLWSKDKE